VIRSGELARGKPEYSNHAAFRFPHSLEARCMYFA